MIEELIEIAKSYVGKTPESFKDCHNWTDLEERMEIEMRRCTDKTDTNRIITNLSNVKTGEANHIGIRG